MGWVMENFREKNILEIFEIEFECFEESIKKEKQRNIQINVTDDRKSFWIVMPKISLTLEVNLRKWLW